MNRALFFSASVVAAASLAGGLPAFADGGRIGFSGAIVEPSCPMRDDGLHCPSVGQGSAVIRSLDMRTAQRQVRVALFDYALRREPSTGWRLIEVTYR